MEQSFYSKISDNPDKWTSSGLFFAQSGLICHLRVSATYLRWKTAMWALISITLNHCFLENKLPRKCWFMIRRACIKVCSNIYECFSGHFFVYEWSIYRTSCNGLIQAIKMSFFNSFSLIACLLYSRIWKWIHRSEWNNFPRALCSLVKVSLLRDVFAQGALCWLLLLAGRAGRAGSLLKIFRWLNWGQKFQQIWLQCPRCS